MCGLVAAGAGALCFCLIAFVPFAFSAPPARAAQPDTPILGEHLSSTAWNDDAWHVAVRCENRSAGFRFAGAVGYMKHREPKFDEWSDSSFDPVSIPLRNCPPRSGTALLSERASSSEGDT
jgi:hypothetical protein